MLCQAFDIDGNFVQDDFYDRLITVSLDDIRKIPVRVGVAYGENKKEAILGALRSGLVNVLITDMEVAEYLINV